MQWGFDEFIDKFNVTYQLQLKNNGSVPCGVYFFLSVRWPPFVSSISRFVHIQCMCILFVQNEWNIFVMLLQDFVCVIATWRVEGYGPLVATYWLKLVPKVN